MKFSQWLWMDVVSNQTKPYQTKPYQSKPTLNLLYISQKKSDFDEIFTVALNGWCLKPYQTIPYQTNFQSSLNQSKQVGFKWNFHSSFRWMSSQTQTNHTIPNQTLPNWNNCKSSLKQPKQVGFWWNFHSNFGWMLSQTIPY